MPPTAGDLKLCLPPRLGIGTVKAAAWQVLAEAGPEGMPVYDIAREIQKRGFRDLRSSKTPESSGACGDAASSVRLRCSKLLCVQQIHMALLCVL